MRADPRRRGPLTVALLAGLLGCRGSSRPADAGAIPNDGAAPADQGGPAAGQPDRQKVLADLVRVVAIPAYSELRDGAVALSGALAAVQAAATTAALTEARQAWRLTRGLWRRTSAFGIGPAEDLALTGGILDEPTNGVRLEALLAGASGLDATALRSLPANLRGLLAVEYLLFEPDLTDEAMAQRLAGEGGARRTMYLALLGQEIAEKVSAVLQAWSSRYGTDVAEAGRSSGVFARERDAYDALLNKALAISDRTIDSVRSGAGGMAATPPPLALRSDNVVPDVRDDLRGLESLYSGRLGTASGASIAELVRAINPAADVQMTGSLLAAAAALDSLPRPLRPGASAEPVMGAITALRAVKAALVTGVFSALGVSVGFTDNDGD